MFEVGDLVSVRRLPGVWSVVEISGVLFLRPECRESFVHEQEEISLYGRRLAVAESDARARVDVMFARAVTEARK
jgi:hypothetical protein